MVHQFGLNWNISTKVLSESSLDAIQWTVKMSIWSQGQTPSGWSPRFGEMIPEPMNISGDRAFTALNWPSVPNKTDTALLAYAWYSLKLWTLWGHKWEMWIIKRWEKCWGRTKFDQAFFFYALLYSLGIRVGIKQLWQLFEGLASFSAA